MHGDWLCRYRRHADRRGRGRASGSSPAITSHDGGRGEPEQLQVLAEQAGQRLAHLGLWARRVLGLPATHLPDSHAESIGEGLLGAESGCQARCLEAGVARGSWHVQHLR